MSAVSQSGRLRHNSASQREAALVATMRVPETAETPSKKRDQISYTALAIVAKASRALCAASVLLLLVFAPYMTQSVSGESRMTRSPWRLPASRMRGNAAVSSAPDVHSSAEKPGDDAGTEIAESDGSHLSKSRYTTRKPLGLAPPAAILPPICVVKPAYHAWRDRDCYLEMEKLNEAEAAITATAPYCWGRASDSVLRPDVNASLLFQTVALTELPGASKLLIDSFLATQCCDAVLWVWLDKTAMATARASGSLPQISSHHAGRVLFRPLDVDEQFAAVRADFPDVNDTAAANMKNFDDIRFQANWARLLVLYRFGGVYVDLDTMFLRDFRPLDALPNAFTYRQGSEIIMNIAVLSLKPRPDRATRDLIAEAAKRHRVSQSALSLIMEPWSPVSRWAGTIDYLASALFDVMWYRFLAWSLRYHNNAEAEALAVQTPELAARIDAQGSRFNAELNWDAFFTSLPYDEVEVIERENLPFFAGSFSYHWHNRYHMGVPELSWAGILHRRFQKMLNSKVCVAPK